MLTNCKGLKKDNGVWIAAIRDLRSGRACDKDNIWQKCWLASHVLDLLIKLSFLSLFFSLSFFPPLYCSFLFLCTSSYSVCELFFSLPLPRSPSLYLCFSLFASVSSLFSCSFCFSLSLDSRVSRRRIPATNTHTFALTDARSNTHKRTHRHSHRN